MDITTSFLHLLAFVMPALAVALATSLGARWLLRPGSRLPLWLQWTLLSAIGSAVLLLGLWYFGRDGKMATYAAMVACCASGQWVLLRLAAR